MVGVKIHMITIDFQVPTFKSEFIESCILEYFVIITVQNCIQSKNSNSLQRTKLQSPMCPLFGDSTVLLTCW